MNDIPEFDNILYETPSPGEPTPVLERALRELKELPPTRWRLASIAMLEQELASRAADETA